MKTKIIIFLALITLVVTSCSNEDCIELSDLADTNCEGNFYISQLITPTDNLDVDYALGTFNQPIENPLNINEIEKIDYALSNFNAFPSNFSDYDQVNNKYAFLYNYDDEPLKILYLANTNPLSSESFTIEQDYAAPVFLNGKLYAVRGPETDQNLNYEILEIDQNNGIGTSIFSDTVTIDGIYANRFVSSASNGIDTIYFLGIKTIISYNVFSGVSQVLGIDIQYDGNIQTALTGLEYRTETNQLIAIHHKLNSPVDDNEVISINPENGTYSSLFNLADAIGTGSGNTTELLINSTTYSSCSDTYFITQLTNTDAEPFDNKLLSIDLTNSQLTEQPTDSFIYGITIAE